MMAKKQSIKRKSLSFSGERMIPELNKGMALYYQHLSRYLLSAPLLADKIVLDVGSGTGYGSFIASKYGKAKKIFGVDISEEAIDYAKANYKRPNINFTQGDVEELKGISSESIDVALAFEVIEHVDDPIKLLSQIKRVLKNKGLLIVSTPNKYTYPPNNVFHKKEYFPDEFRTILKRFFKNVVFYHQCSGIAEMVKSEDEETFDFNEPLTKSKGNFYTEPTDGKKSQYIIAFCSDEILPQVETFSFVASKIDNFDFSRGTEYCNSLLQLNELKMSKQLLEAITASKFYKVWRMYCWVKDRLLPSNSHA